MPPPTKQQAQAANPAASAWVQANAGSGKTRVLVDRVARLLLQGVDPQSILCLTYTKAAASEMQKRLFERLGRWCVATAETLQRELAQLHATDNSTPSMEQARALFAKALETPGGLRIQTIHAFCSRILRRFPLEAGIAPGFRELDEIQTARLHSQILLESVAQMAREMPDTIHSFVQIAGAQQTLETLTAKLLGSRGKLADFAANSHIEDACASIKQNMQLPDENRACLLSKTMEQDLPRSLLAKLLPTLEAGAKIDTASAEILRTLSGKSTEQKWLHYRHMALTKELSPRKNNPYTKQSARRYPDIEKLFRIEEEPQGSEIRRILKTEETLRQLSCYERAILLLRVGWRMEQDLEKKKHQLGGLDFDDLIRLSLSLLTQSRGRDWVRWKLDADISDILIDEAQDTSASQWKLLQALSEEFFSEEKKQKPRTMFAVGDNKQSIYGFQGAKPELFQTEGLRINAAAKIANLPFTSSSLDVSFRSAPPILNFVDAVFATPPPDTPANWAEQAPEFSHIPKHTPHRQNRPGYVELWTPAASPQHNENQITGLAALKTYSKAPPHAKTSLAQQISQYLRLCLQRGDNIDDPETGAQRPLQPGDILILVRGRKTGLFDALLFALQRDGLPVAGADRMMLRDSAPVQDILNLARFALCKEDDLVLAELLTSPFCGLNIEKDLFPLAHDRGKTSLWQQLNNSGKHQQACRFLKKILEHRHKPVFEFFAHLLETPGPNRNTGYESLLQRFGPPACMTIDALIDQAVSATGPEASSLQLFLDSIERDGGDIKRDTDTIGNEIRVMTVHGAKGSEAPFVILPDTCSAPGNIEPILFSDHGFPVWIDKKPGHFEKKLREKAETNILREHFRLLYVALTRARDRLLICGPRYGKNKSGYHKNSWMALCLKTMEKMDADTARENHDENTRFQMGNKPLRSSQTQNKKSDPVPEWLKQPIPKITPTPIFMTPSRSGQDGPSWHQSSTTQKRRGQHIHTLLEHLPALKQPQRKNAAKRLLDRYHDLSETERADIIDSTLKTLDHPGYADLFGPDSRAEIPVAAKITGGNGQNFTIHGRIDRLIIQHDHIRILDFKTSPNAPEQAKDVHPDIIRQMACYKQMISRLFPGKDVHCLILWTAIPSLMQLPDNLTAEIPDLRMTTGNAI